MKEYKQKDFQRIMFYENLNIKLFTLLIFLVVLSLFGAILNHEVVISNDNKMPVKTDYKFETRTHFSYQKDCQILKPQLSDIYDFGKYILSIGDLIMFNSIFWALVLSSFLVINNIKYAKFKKSIR